jgi:DNA-binding NtrC family response regulator
VPVIVLSKHGNVDDYIESMGLGAFEYLNKPVSRGEVTRIVKAALQQAEAA